MQTIKHKQSKISVKWTMKSAEQHTSLIYNMFDPTGTEVSCDHRLVITKMRIERFYLYKKNKVKFDATIDTDRLQRQEVSRKYSEELRKEFEKIK